MTVTEIKKALYKENPVAKFRFFRKGILYYDALIPGKPGERVIQFSVPASDTGDADFCRNMEAKHLIRYITQ